jgi:lysophospholipase L1-like esterase
MRLSKGSHLMTIRSATLTLIAILLLAACSAPHTTAVVDPSPTPTPRGPYVALGDSYTAAPKVPNQTGTPAGCERSSANYPALVAQRLKIKANLVHDVSCSGAKIADLSAAQDTGNGTTNAAQLSALTADTALVTVGIGGNDVDFAGILSRCVELDAPGTIIDLLRNITADETPCRGYYTSEGIDQIQQKIQDVAPILAATLADIRSRAPHAHVYVVGYPALLPATDGVSCATSLGITPTDVSFLSNEELRLNTMLKLQATAAEDTYVDTYTPSLGHDACSDPATRWIEPLFPAASAAPLHPNAVGEQGMAAAAERAVAR